MLCCFIQVNVLSPKGQGRVPRVSRITRIDRISGVPGVSSVRACGKTYEPISIHNGAKIVAIGIDSIVVTPWKPTYPFAIAIEKVVVTRVSPERDPFTTRIEQEVSTHRVPRRLTQSSHEHPVVLPQVSHFM